MQDSVASSSREWQGGIVEEFVKAGANLGIKSDGGGGGGFGEMVV
jgi:hypothetical protein